MWRMLDIKLGVAELELGFSGAMWPTYTGQIKGEFNMEAIRWGMLCGAGDQETCLQNCLVICYEQWQIRKFCIWYSGGT